MRKIIVRADDLGWTESINYGICKTIKDGIIRSVGLMPNMDASEHGFELIKDFDVCIGQHTNICVGKPLTDPEKIPSLCDENGEFKRSKEYRAAYAEGRDFVDLDEVVLEIEAQYDRFKAITGQEPRYFEGHAVASDNFFEGLRIVAERHSLSYLPFAAGEPVKFKNTTLYTSMDSMKEDYDPFESLKKAALADYGEDGCAMFVCHPGYLDNEILTKSSLTIPRVKEVEMASSEETKNWLKENDIEVITYDDLR